MFKNKQFMLLFALLSFLVSACGNIASVEATITPTQEPTVTPEPTATETPTATPLPTVEPFFTGIEGITFHLLCGAIKAEYPQVGCPIVVQEKVPLDHYFLAFVDDFGQPTGFGLDFGRDPATFPGFDQPVAGVIFDMDSDPLWCGGVSGVECDAWLFLIERSPTWGLDVGSGFKAQHIDYSSQEAYLTPLPCDCERLWHESWMMFPISLRYQEILESLGVQFVVYEWWGD